MARAASLPRLLAALAVPALAGCATVFKERTESVAITSEPAGAQVWVDGQLRGSTPVVLALEADRSYEVELRKDGHAPQRRTLAASVSVTWLVLDLVAGGLPLIVDAATGAWYTLDPAPLRTRLERSAEPDVEYLGRADQRGSSTAAAIGGGTAMPSARASASAARASSRRPARNAA